MQEQVKSYSEQDQMLGVPETEEVMDFAVEERQKRMAEVAGYLSLLPEAQVIEAAERVVGLYSKSATVLSQFNYKAVDVYAEAAGQVLETSRTDASQDTLRRMHHARKMVEAQRFAFVRSRKPATDS